MQTKRISCTDKTAEVRNYSIVRCYLFATMKGGCRVSFSGDIQDPPGQGPVQPALGDPASAGGVD